MLSQIAEKIPKLFFRFAGVAIFVLLLIFWLSEGAHPGWTQTEVTVWLVDELTEIRYPETHDKLLPGIEFPTLGFGVMVGLVLFDLVLSKFKTNS